MSKEKSFLEDNTGAIGWSVCISSTENGTNIVSKHRSTPGGPLEISSIENASNTQLYTICDILDNL